MIKFYLGWAFKKNTNDTRESAAIYVANNLLNKKISLDIYDPKVKESQVKFDLSEINPEYDESLINFLENPFVNISQYNVIVILTEWDEFVDYDWKGIYSKIKKPAYIFDGRNILNVSKISEIGFNYIGLEEDKLKTILVTGGAGFIGSHLCTVLVDKGNKVICLDNLITGSKRNINQLLKRKNFEFINHDITEPFYRNQIDEIYNLACPASPIQYRNNPIKTIKTCTIGVINILGLAKKNNAKILQASTSEVYGDPETHPQNECYNGNVNVMSPRACYDEGKRCAETLFIDYHREHNLDIGVRIFNTYGPNMSINDGRVVSNFICQAIQGKNITVNGTGKQEVFFTLMI